MMSITTISSREFNHDVSKAKKASNRGPVFITDRGHTAHVLLSIDEYQKITNKQKSIVALLTMDGVAEVDFEPAHLNNLQYPVDLS